MKLEGKKEPDQIGETRGKKNHGKQDQARNFWKNRLETSRSRYLCERPEGGKMSEDSNNLICIVGNLLSPWFL